MDFIRLAEFGSRLEAETVGHALDAHEIPYLVKGDDVGLFGMAGAQGFAGGIALWVPGDRIEEVSRLLDCVVPSSAGGGARKRFMSFARRAAGRSERMDDPDCDPDCLERTYRQFGAVNRLFAGWRGLYRRMVRPMLRERERDYTVLDVGCGAGDLLARLHRWAHRDGYRLSLTGIDTDSRAIRHAAGRCWPDAIRFQHASSADLASSGARFDFVISNHVLHHLSEDELVRLAEDVGTLTRRLAVMSDGVRSGSAYVLFTVIASPLFHRSFIVEDGQLSIRRAYRPHELRALLPPAWDVRPVFPFRQAAVYRAEG